MATRFMAILLVTVLAGCATTPLRTMQADAENQVRSRGDCPQGCTLRSEVKRMGPDWAVIVNIIQPDGSQEIGGMVGVIFDDAGQMKGYIHGF